jgi:hypothetical protein
VSGRLRSFDAAVDHLFDHHWRRDPARSMRWIDSPLDISRKFEALARDWPRSGAQYRWSAADRGYKRVSGRRRFSVCRRPRLAICRANAYHRHPRWRHTNQSPPPLFAPARRIPHPLSRRLDRAPVDFDGAKRAAVRTRAPSVRGAVSARAHGGRGRAARSFRQP